MGVAHRAMQPAHEGLTIARRQGVRWNGTVRLLPERLAVPFKWKRHRLVFVDSMSDLFHPSVPFDFIAAVYGVMAACERHTFQILTKRIKRARAFGSWVKEGRATPQNLCAEAAARLWPHEILEMEHPAELDGLQQGPWPLPNVWLGTSVEDQKRADERIQELTLCPAEVRFLSIEPLLGPVRFYDLPLISGWTGLHWVIVGGESGPGARPFELDWARELRDECAREGIPFFLKQLGRFPVDGGVPLELADRKGGNIDEWPEDLQIRQWPASLAEEHRP